MAYTPTHYAPHSTWGIGTKLWFDKDDGSVSPWFRDANGKKEWCNIDRLDYWDEWSGKTTMSTKTKGTIEEMWDRLEVGMRVMTNGDYAVTTGSTFQGMIVEKRGFEGRQIIAIRREDGERGGGPNRTWQIAKHNNYATVEILSKETYSSATPVAQTTKPMANVLEFFRSITATAEDKLLKELGLEEPIGTPTDLGLRLSAEIAYKANRAAVIDIAKKMKEEQEAAKK